MPPRDAYESMRVLKLRRHLRTEAAHWSIRAQALGMLVERAGVQIQRAVIAKTVVVLNKSIE